MPLSQIDTHNHGQVLFFRIVGIICQTLVYGIYVCLVPISTYVMIKKGLQTRARKFLFAMTIFMFVLASVHWAVSVTLVIALIKTWFDTSDPTGVPPDYLPIFNAIILINYILTDGVVVWRAWVLCGNDGKKKMFVPIAFLVLNSLIYIATVGVRIALSFVSHNSRSFDQLTRSIDVTQVTNLGLSLLTNVLATSIVAHKACLCRRKYRTLVSSNLGSTSTRASRVLALLVESGTLYILIGVSVLVSLVIRLPFGTLGDLFAPVSVQLAGMYPIIVLLLVDQEHSLDKTAFYSTGVPSGPGRGSSGLGPMRFAHGRSDLVPNSTFDTEAGRRSHAQSVHVHLRTSSDLQQKASTGDDTV
ncbi:hypothetical protein BC834DRAFT_984112 [Gloeopeniophorella convolvens]|nr:hypothetical protein BC834DRAFT_984112 [Gloeopeniophorella convolvens]